MAQAAETNREGTPPHTGRAQCVIIIIWLLWDRYSFLNSVMIQKALLTQAFDCNLIMRGSTHLSIESSSLWLIFLLITTYCLAHLTEEYKPDTFRSSLSSSFLPFVTKNPTNIIEMCTRWLLSILNKGLCVGSCFRFSLCHNCFYF